MLAALPLVALLAVDDVERHVVEEEAPRRNRFELELFQATQINGVSTQHYGLGVSGVWQVQQHVGLMLTWVGNFWAQESGLTSELINRTRTETNRSDALLLNGGVLAGVEVAPLQGKLAFYESHLLHFSFVLNGGVGVGAMRAQLKPSADCSNASSSCFTEPTFGDAGLRFMGEVGGGLRVRLGDFVAIRLELRDLIYGANVSTINGCDAKDFRAIDFPPLASGPMVSRTCDLTAFSGRDASGRPRSLDVPLADALLHEPQTVAIINNLGLYVGASATF